MLWAVACAPAPAPAPSTTPATSTSSSSDPTGEAEAVLGPEGGELVLDDGATLIVPPGALGEAATVRLERTTCDGAWSSATFGACRYAVRAPGVEWAGRYRVGIPARSDGARPVRDAEDGWPPLFDGSFDGGLLWASASTSGAFSARVAAANPTDDRCADLAFDPCGGAIEGHWTLAAACGTADQVTGQSSYGGDDPYAGCDPLDHVEDQPFEAHGSLSFGGDGTYDTTDRFTEWGHTTTTLACLDAIGWACDEPCTSDGTTCDCTWVDGEGVGAGYGGAWAYGADPGTVDLDGASLRYCVDGDSLILERLTAGTPWVPGDPYYLVYDRG